MLSRPTLVRLRQKLDHTVHLLPATQNTSTAAAVAGKTASTLLLKNTIKQMGFKNLYVFRIHLSSRIAAFYF